MDSVFISSVQRGFELERQAARNAVESLGPRPIMAETVGASPLSSRDALLGHVDQADVFILILGARYGERGESGYSPTEDEFNRAVDESKDILVFVQDGIDREPEQSEFIARVRGRWEKGAFTSSFRTPEELGFAIVRALRELGELRQGGDAAPAAQARAHKLALGDQRPGCMSGGCMVRISFVPVGTPLLLDAVALDDYALPDRVSDIVRSRRIVPHSAAIDVQVTSDGVQLTGKDPSAFSSHTVIVGAAGEIAVGSDCRAEGMLGGSAIDHDRVAALVDAASAAAQDIWELVDTGSRVRQVAVALGVPDAGMKVYAVGNIGNSMSMPMSNPSAIVAPDPPALVRRNDVGAGPTKQKLLASLKRAFADNGAVHA